MSRPLAGTDPAGTTTIPVASTDAPLPLVVKYRRRKARAPLGAPGMGVAAINPGGAAAAGTAINKDATHAAVSKIFIVES